LAAKFTDGVSDGVYGVRLHATQIDTERMYLVFGDVDQTMRVELLLFRGDGRDRCGNHTLDPVL
jgi:hypothetical protein